MTESSVITNKLLIIMAGLIIFSALISQPFMYLQVCTDYNYLKNLPPFLKVDIFCRQTVGIPNIGILSKMGFSCKGKNMFPEGANYFHERVESELQISI